MTPSPLCRADATNQPHASVTALVKQSSAERETGAVIEN
jgi:hypothetical protein